MLKKSKNKNKISKLVCDVAGIKNMYAQKQVVAKDLIDSSIFSLHLFIVP